jgi:hypothetical protein
MWECEDLPLIKYFQAVSVGAKAAGFQQLMVLLSREADAPWIFRDLGREWGSLNDLSSERVLFCFAGEVGQS